jgi:hypothetical protein
VAFARKAGLQRAKAIGCNDGKINFAGEILARTDPGLCVGIRIEDDGIETESGNPGASL